MTATVIPYNERGLDAVDRCDRCGAQAYVEATMNAGVVLLCAKHGTENFAKLLEGAIVIADYRPWLNAQEEALRNHTEVKK